MIEGSWRLGPVVFSTYGTVLSLALLAALLVTRPELRARRISMSYLLMALPPVALFTWVGAVYAHALDLGGLDALGYWIYAPLAHPGSAFLGGLLGFVSGMILYCWTLRRCGVLVSPLGLLDSAAPGLMLAYGIGRLGCHLAGHRTCCGDTTQSWLGVAYPYTMGEHARVVPTALFEALAGVLLFLVLHRIQERHDRPGLMFARCLVLLGLERFCIEFWRTNPRHAFGLTQAQWISLVMVAGSLGWMLVARLSTAGPEPSPAPRLGHDQLDESLDPQRRLHQHRLVPGSDSHVPAPVPGQRRPL